jgi:hypothetical protein
MFCGIDGDQHAVAVTDPACDPADLVLTGNPGDRY